MVQHHSDESVEICYKIVQIHHRDFQNWFNMHGWDQKTSEYEELTSAIFNIDEIIEDGSRAIVCQ